ncbi:hypothetical protein ACFW04_012224 [Cataglyphis niger]
MYATMGLSQQQHSFKDRSSNAIARPFRILRRRYPLTKTGYKHLEVCINVSRPLFVEIVLGDTHGKEISLTPDTWKELLDLRSTFAYFQPDAKRRALRHRYTSDN